MITHAASRKHYYTVLLDRTLGGNFYNLVGQAETGHPRPKKQPTGLFFPQPAACRPGRAFKSCLAFLFSKKFPPFGGNSYNLVGQAETSHPRPKKQPTGLFFPRPASCRPGQAFKSCLAFLFLKKSPPFGGNSYNLVGQAGFEPATKRL